ncbi:hypothetical protein ACFFTN_13190 [Aminobacter aganoensis]|uniref:Uncharacterized protein n=1 Tax=Aminobacter aganoensis TaxID=83264 RepID=A0A7X0FA59_9HYPH|nr:hypothetical protein [Aminobacter aganoensis]MBB6355733.1 hypothetical protein [Aminobacter aganoensis]
MLPHSSTATTDRLACEAGILAPWRRAALLRNKTVILDTLAAARIARADIEFEDLPFGCYIHSANAYGDAGRFILPALQLRYAEPGRRLRFRHRKLHLIAALSRMLDDLLGDAWNSALDAEGILNIDVQGRVFLLSGHSKDVDRQAFRRLY